LLWLNAGGQYPIEVGRFVGLLLGRNAVGVLVGYFGGDKDKVGLTLGGVVVL
jgi:hypothetical protein